MPTAYKPLIFLNFSKFYNYTPTKGKRHDPRRAFSLWPEDGTCSGEMNSPCAEGLGTAQTPWDGVPDAAGLWAGVGGIWRGRQMNMGARRGSCSFSISRTKHRNTFHAKGTAVRRAFFVIALLFGGDQVAHIGALAGEHFVVERLFPVDIGHAVLQFLDGGQ